MGSEVISKKITVLRNGGISEFAELGDIVFASWCLAIFLFPSNIVMLPP